MILPKLTEGAEEMGGVGGSNRRILVIDDRQEIHRDFRNVLMKGDTSKKDDLDDLKRDLFGDEPGDRPDAGLDFEVSSAHQGQEGLEMVQAACDEGKPYAMAFVDMRMPPGWDGVTTIEKIWEVDPSLQIVICTAFSDLSWQEIQGRLGNTDRLLILRKPFDVIEVRQFACALTQKWELKRRANLKQGQMEQLAQSQNIELCQAYEDLESTNESLRQMIQEKEQVEKRLRYDAFHDRLTGLPNRVYLTDRLKQCIVRKERAADFMFAVLFIDLDNFKIINDSLGHDAGDRFLVEIARRISNNLRTLDAAIRPNNDTTARLGGDEFIVLLDGIRDSKDAKVVAERILASMGKPVDIDGQEVSVSASIGIATSAFYYEEPGEILRDADTSMYHAKHSGKNQWAIFDKSMHDSVLARLKIENDLGRAVERDQLRLCYQPIVSLESGKIVAVEALLRWNHPDHGPIMPDKFVAIAEETGAIVEMGGWVLKEACRQVQVWRQTIPGQEALELNVNISPRHLVHGSLLRQIKEIQDANEFDLDALRLEITETVVVKNGRELDEIIEQIKAFGVSIHMDDFGTGYSSLSLLDNIDYDTLKIDRSFLKGLPHDRRAIASVQAIIQLAHLREYKVVAEGVETYDMMIQLQALDCDFAQGFFFARPLDPIDAHSLLASNVIWATG